MTASTTSPAPISHTAAHDFATSAQDLRHITTRIETEWERLDATRTFLLLVDLLTEKIVNHAVRDQSGGELSAQARSDQLGLSVYARELRRLARVGGPAASRRMDVEGGPVVSGSIRQRGKSKDAWELRFELPPIPRRASARGSIGAFGVRSARRRRSWSNCRAKPPAAGSSTIPGNPWRILNPVGSRFGFSPTSVRKRARDGTNCGSIRSRVALVAPALQRIKPAHLVELYAALAREGGVGGKPLAPVTVGHCHRLLRRAFGHALTWGLIQQNPAAVARPPRVVDEEIEIPSESEIAIGARPSARARSAALHLRRGRARDRNQAWRSLRLGVEGLRRRRRHAAELYARWKRPKRKGF